MEETETNRVVFDAVDNFVEACLREQTAAAESIVDAVDSLPEDKEAAQAQVMELIRQSGAADNLTRCLGAGALEDLAREVVWQWQSIQRSVRLAA